MRVDKSKAYHALLHFDVRMKVLSVDSDDDDALRVLLGMGPLLVDDVDPGQDDVQVGVVSALVHHELQEQLILSKFKEKTCMFFSTY